MPIKIEEQDLIFEFGDDWHVVKFDDHPDFLNKIRKFKKSCALDFVAVYNGEILWLIEVKDFRGFRSNNRQRITTGDLAMEVATKVRDSIAGAVGARQMSSTLQDWKPIAHCLNRNNSIFVVLWLEEDIMRYPAYLTTLTDDIKGHLRWLTTRVMVSKIGSPRHPLALTVRYKSGAIRP